MQPNQPQNNLPQFQSNPYAQTAQTATPVGLPKKSNIVLIVAITSSVFFIVTLVFAIWAFAGMLDNKNNVDKKVEAANKVAVAEADKKKDEEFAEAEKSPYRTYSGPSTYGSITFEYPKTWSMYITENENGAALEILGHPYVLPSFDSKLPYALHMKVLTNAYDKELSNYMKDAEKGTVAITSFALSKVPDQVGARISGEIEKGKQGVVVLLPQRDKTILISTQAPEYIPDLETLLASFSYVP